MVRIGVLIDGKEGEVKKSHLGVLSAARQHGDKLYALMFSDCTEARRDILQRYGVDRIVVVKMPGIAAESRPEAQAGALALAIEEFQLDALLGVAGPTGKDLLARVASLKGTSLVQDCLNIDFSSGVIRKSHFSGRAIATIRLKGRPWILTVRPHSFPEASNPRGAEIIEYKASVEDRGRLVVSGVKGAASGGADLSEAEIIISGGRAVGSTENFRILNECASSLGAAVGASRAAVDAGFASHAMQVGQTGKTVSPRLYIACGISGSVQHFAGMKTSKVIVAINNDSDAPIFQKCDYGLLGDLFEVLPALTRTLGPAQANKE